MTITIEFYKDHFSRRFQSVPNDRGGGAADNSSKDVVQSVFGDPDYSIDSQFLSEGYQADGTTTDELIREAVQTAKEANQVLLIVGSFLPGEDDDYNRKDIKLSEGMTRLIDAVSAVNKNCIVILSSGEVCEMPWRHQVSAVLLTWFSGEGMGSAIADILFGKVSPSGRLANTVPERL